MTDPGHNRGFGDGNQYLAAAIRFALAVTLFLFGGLALDKRLRTTPLFTIVGALGGAVLGFLSVYREIRADPDHKVKLRSWSDKRRDSDSP
jgi:F0F1-type ATP synthase assembly protein I